MAELLVRAKPHWMDSLSPDAVAKMGTEERKKYNARTQIGDVVVIKPDGWRWGKEECPPNFVVIKVPGTKVEDLKRYTEQLTEKNTEAGGQQRPSLIKYRRYTLGKLVVDEALLKPNGYAEKTQAEIESMAKEKAGSL